MQDHTWILDVLGDIGTYAELNQLPELEKAVNHAHVMAVAESILKLVRPEHRRQAASLST